MIKKTKLAFVGLTHLGLNYLAASASKKYSVLGIDSNKNKIKKLNDNIIEYREPNLKKTILKNKKNIYFSNDFKKLKQCDLVFISEDVKTDLKGKSNLKSLRVLINKTIKFLNKNSVLIILSQMRPGFIRSIQIDHDKLYHQVETLIFGKAMNRAMYPERIIVGCKDKSKKLNSRYKNYLNEFNCKIFKMNYESAEVAKLSINLLLSSSVTITNILTELCENVSANWKEIVPALKSDKRIGKYSYIRPGLGISGGNLERDIVTVKNILNKNSPPRNFLNNILENSKYMKFWVIRTLDKLKILDNKNKMHIGIVGATYKENTNSIKNSPTIDLLKILIKKNITIYEPMLNLNLKNNNINQIKNIKELVSKNKVIIFMRPWTNFREIQNVSKIIRNKIVIDPYGVIDAGYKENKIKKYFTIGKS